MKVLQSKHTKVWLLAPLQGQVHRKNEDFTIIACKASAGVAGLDICASMASFDFDVDTELVAVAWL